MKDEIKKNIISLIFTGMLATPITYYFQKKYYSYENENNKRKEERTLSMDYLMEISSKMDRRIYAMDKCVKSLKNNDKIEESWKNYQLELDDWNGNLNRNIILSEFHFDKYQKKSFEDIHRNFVSLGKGIDFAKRNQKTGDGTPNFSKEFGLINKQMSGFLEHGLKEIYEKGELKDDSALQFN